VCKHLQRIRDGMVKEGREEISYQRWAEAAGVDEAVLKSRLQEGYWCRERLLVAGEVHCTVIHGNGDGFR
jgi:RNA polymerase sigma factor